MIGKLEIHWVSTLSRALSHPFVQAMSEAFHFLGGSLCVCVVCYFVNFYSARLFSWSLQYPVFSPHWAALARLC